MGYKYRYEPQYVLMLALLASTLVEIAQCNNTVIEDPISDHHLCGKYGNISMCYTRLWICLNKTSTTLVEKAAQINMFLRGTDRGASRDFLFPTNKLWCHVICLDDYVPVTRVSERHSHRYSSPPRSKHALVFLRGYSTTRAWHIHTHNPADVGNIGKRIK